MPDRDSPTPCTICGADSRVLIGSVPYCLGCYNHMTDALSGVEPPTNDDYRILTLDADGRRSVVVDGQRLDAEEFLDLLSCFEGFDLWWEVRHATDEVPEWWG